MNPADQWSARRCLGVALLVGLVAAAAGSAQAPAAGDAAASAPTLTVQSRLVIEDVLVTDAQGRPVHGLPASAFHLSDRGAPQTIRSVEEGQPGAGDGRAPATRPLPPGVFTNAVRGDEHTASEVMLIDADGMALTDQMFLLGELRRALGSLPAGLQVAVFRVSSGRPVQIRGFTTDREDLRRALGECLPVQTHALGSQFASAVDQLLAVAGLLEQTPGRKNLLWFAGAFPLIPVPADEQAAGGVNVDFRERERTIQQIYEALAEARITVYPVDVRGVLNRDLAPPSAGSSAGAGASRSPRDTSGFGGTKVVQVPGADGVATERDQMRQLARATGGKAYFLNNLSEEVGEAFDLGMRAYTLSYTPTPYATDESWHPVRITVDGDYRLAYRPGYLATFTGVAGGRQGVRLEEGGKRTVSADLPGRTATQPIIFTVKVEPQATGKGAAVPIGLMLRVPTEELDFVKRGERWSNRLVVTTYAYDGDGRVKGGKVQELNTELSDAQWQQAHGAGQQVGAAQLLLAPKSAKYLVIAVEDEHSRRSGSYFLSMRTVRALLAEGGSGTTAGR